MAGSLVHTWTGIPTTTNVLIKTRTSLAAKVRLKYSTDPALSTNVTYSAPQTPDASGYSTHVLSDLPAGTSYVYKVEVDGVLASRIGKFTTNGANSFKIAFGSCLKSGDTSSGAFKNALSSGASMFLHLGDFHYDNLTSTDAAKHRGAIETQIKKNTSLAQVLAEMPTAYMWSDHDSGGNDWNPGPGSQTPAVNSSYRTVVPVSDLPSTNGCYHSFVRGRIRFILTDSRSFKSKISATDSTSKSMFGLVQKAWIKEQLLAPEPVKVLCLEVPWVQKTSTGGDKWGGYTTERAEIAKFVTDHGVNVWIINGDEHALSADDGTNSAGKIPCTGAAPFGNTTSIKGGPYSNGTYPVASAVGGAASNVGILDFKDSGSSITISFSGLSSEGKTRVSMSKTFAADGSPAPEDPEPAPLPNPIPTPEPVPEAHISAPTGLKAAVSSKRITLSWLPVPGAVKYNVYEPGTVGKPVATVTTASRTSGTLSSGTYNYSVTALDASGIESSRSIVLSVKV